MDIQCVFSWVRIWMTSSWTACRTCRIHMWHLHTCTCHADVRPCQCFRNLAQLATQYIIWVLPWLADRCWARLAIVCGYVVSLWQHWSRSARCWDRLCAMCSPCALHVCLRMDTVHTLYPQYDAFREFWNLSRFWKLYHICIWKSVDYLSIGVWCALLVCLCLSVCSHSQDTVHCFLSIWKVEDDMCHVNLL